MPGDLGYPFRQARHYSAGRAGYTTIWIVWHATDDDESPTYAEGLANYFATTDREVSTHFGVDSNSVYQYVRLADTAYGAGSPGNTRGIHIEHAGRSGQSRAQWLDTFGVALFEQSAALNAALHRRTGIPFRGRYLTDTELRNRVPGTTRHMDLVRVFGGTHDRCPSLDFPGDYLFARVAAHLEGDVDMEPTTQVPKADDVDGPDFLPDGFSRPFNWWVSAQYLHILQGEREAGRSTAKAAEALTQATAARAAAEAAAATAADVRAAVERLEAGGGQVDHELLADLLAARLAARLAE